MHFGAAQVHAARVVSRRSRTRAYNGAREAGRLALQRTIDLVALAALGTSVHIAFLLPREATCAVLRACRARAHPEEDRDARGGAHASVDRSTHARRAVLRLAPALCARRPSIALLVVLYLEYHLLLPVVYRVHERVATVRS